MRNFKYLIFLVLVLVVAGSGCGVNKKEYKNEIIDIKDKMIENASEAEEILNQYATVWSRSIENRGAFLVSEIVAITGLEEYELKKYFNLTEIGTIMNDFSSNVHSMKYYYEDIGKLEEIEMNSKEVKERINNLESPPKEFKEAYDELIDMYEYTEQYIDLALNPSGSLQEFNNKRSQLTDDIIGKHKRIEVLLPSE